MNDSLQTQSLTTFQLMRPEKVRWISSLLPNQSPQEVIKSKSLRKFLSSANEICENAGITLTQEQMTKELFEEWYNFYQLKMNEQGHEVLVTPEWFDRKMGSTDLVFALTYRKDNELVGGAVILETAQYISLAYKASERIDLSGQPGSNFGSVIEYDFLKFAQKRLVDTGSTKTITSGRSRNAFGVINTLGYLEFKLRFGYKPIVDVSEALLDSVPLNSAREVLFFGIPNADLAESGLHAYFGGPKGSDLTQQLSEIKLRLPELEILEW